MLFGGSLTDCCIGFANVERGVAVCYLVVLLKIALCIGFADVEREVTVCCLVVPLQIAV